MMPEEPANENAPNPSRALLLMAFISGYALREQKARWQSHAISALICGLFLGLLDLFVISSGVALPREFYLGVAVEAVAVLTMVLAAVSERRTYMRMYANAGNSFYPEEASGLSKAGIK